MTIGMPTRESWLERIASHGNAQAALRLGDARWSHAVLAGAARVMGERLASIGLAEGDVLAVLAPPSLAGVALIHACLAEGIVLLPLNARQSEDELQRALLESRARALVVSATEEEAASRLLVGGANATDEAGLLVLGSASAGGPELEERRPLPALAGAEWGASRRRRREEGAALVLRTSGTSGRAKGAVLGFDNLIASAMGSAALLGSRATDRWLLCMPLFHIGGLSILIRAALVGARVCLHERFDETEVSRALDHEGITRVSFVATMLERVLEVRAENPAPASLELILLGGGPASESLLARAESLGYPIAPTYGLTEAASQVATRPPGADHEGDRAGGLEALGGVSLRVVDASGRAVGAGIDGEIEVKGPVVMRGYLDDPAATARTIREGWLATGDLGRLDARGRLRVLDRRTDLILSGGENVYPAVIESVLRLRPEIDDVGVIGVPDEIYGARPLAVVVLNAGASLDRGALDRFCAEHLARYECPADYRVADALPRNATGKLVRRDLRSRWSPES